MRTGSTLVRVAPHPSRGWDIREPGSARVLEHADERDRAVILAQRSLAEGGTVHVLDQDGLLQQTYTVAGPGERPWWYAPPTPLFPIIGALFLLQGVLGLASLDPSRFHFWMGTVMAVVGTLYLALVVVSRRRDRQLVQVSERAD